MLKNINSCMMLCIICIICITSIQLNAQESPAVKTFYIDYSQKVFQKSFAPFICTITQEPSSNGLYPVAIFYNSRSRALYGKGWSKDSARLDNEGQFEYFYANGTKSKQGAYQSNQKDGEWNEWDNKGQAEAKMHYTKGMMTGLSMKWFEGKLIDSITLDTQGNGKAFGFFSDGSKNYEGIYANGKRESEWIFYYSTPANAKCFTATYLKDSAVSYHCFTESGELKTSDCIFEQEAKFPEENGGWSGYLVRALNKVKTEKYLKEGKYVVLIKFIVDKNGELTDVQTEDAGNIQELNEAAVNIIKKSPKWIPAVQYNRIVKAYRRQPITFMME